MSSGSNLSKHAGGHSMTIEACTSFADGHSVSTEACTSLARVCVVWRSGSSLELSSLWNAHMRVMSHEPYGVSKHIKLDYLFSSLSRLTTKLQMSLFCSGVGESNGDAIRERLNKTQILYAYFGGHHIVHFLCIHAALRWFGIASLSLEQSIYDFSNANVVLNIKVQISLNKPEQTTTECNI